MLILLFIFTVYLPIDSWQNELLEEAQVRGSHFTNFPSVRPYEIQIQEYPIEDELFSKLWLPNLSADFSYDTVEVLRLKPAVYYVWSLFSVSIQPVVKFGADSLPPFRKFENMFSADYERAYLRMTHANFTMTIGRERFAIGPSPRYNLLLSGYSAPLDWFHYTVQSSRIKFSYYLSRLDDLYTKPLEYTGDTITQFINAKRYLTIKRFDYSPTAWLNFGLSEGAIFGGEDFALEIFHLNPVVLLQAYQFNWGKDANLFMCLDGKIVLNNMSFYISLLIDDFQLEEDPNNEPNHCGVNVGAEFADPFQLRNTFWITEYTAVSRYTYRHFVPFQRYHHRDTPIGSPYGPDYDEFYTKCIYHLNSRFDFYSQISYMRKGESYVDSLWPIPENPRVSGTSFPEQNFLSGVVQKSFHIGLGFRFFHSLWLASDVTLGYFYADNFEHRIGASKNSVTFRLQIDFINL